MPALAVGRTELEPDAPAPSQTTELARQFVGRRGRWMAISPERR